MEQFERIKYLFKQHETKAATSAEEKELFEWLNAPAQKETVNAFFVEELAQQERMNLNRQDWEPLAQQILNLLPSAAENKIVHIRLFRRIMVAAAVLILLLGYWWLLNRMNTPATQDQPLVQQIENDIRPGGNKAIWTLADGKQIELDSTVLDMTSAALQRREVPENVEYNELRTPLGGQYHLILPDGSGVWLNAASSITYPTAFIGNIRAVNIVGEAYFEVVKNTAKPFIVKTGQEEIRVLGTAFNVNAYSDQESAKTSLVEGSIQIGGQTLKPGQAYSNGRIVATNVQQDIAWKNGLFDFNDLTLKQVGKQLARWYDVDVQFSGKVPDVYLFGKAHRSLSLQQIINGLEGEIAHFELKGRTLYIKAL